MRLYAAAPSFGTPEETNLTRWPPKRFREAAEIQTPVEGQSWPETFTKKPPRYRLELPSTADEGQLFRKVTDASGQVYKVNLIYDDESD
jgi:hypothetical protein